MEIIEVCEALIINGQGQIMLQLRDDSPDVNGPGKWGVIGGRQEKGETADGCLRREIKEELGLELVPSLLGTIDDQDGSRVYRHYVYAARCQRDIPEINLQEGKRIEFFYRSEIPSLDKVEWFGRVYQPFINKLEL